MKKGVDAKDRLADVFNNPVICYDNYSIIYEKNRIRSGQICNVQVNKLSHLAQGE